MKNLFLFLSASIGLLAVVPYCLDIIHKKSKPNLVSWITWTLLGAISTAALISAGEYRAAIFTATTAIAPGIVVVFGLRHGYVKYTLFDVICQIGAVVGIILWQLFDDPVLAVLTSVLIDLIGAAPTVRHSWIKPWEETWQTYAISIFTAFLGFLGLENYNFISVIYPFYLFFVCSLFTGIILYRRTKVKNAG